MVVSITSIYTLPPDVVTITPQRGRNQMKRLAHGKTYLTRFITKSYVYFSNKKNSVRHGTVMRCQLKFLKIFRWNFVVKISICSLYNWMTQVPINSTVFTYSTKNYHNWSNLLRSVKSTRNIVECWLCLKQISVIDYVHTTNVYCFYGETELPNMFKISLKWIIKLTIQMSHALH